MNRFFLRQTYLLLTRKCNISCSHCIRVSGPHERGFLDYHLAEDIIDQISFNYPRSTLMLSGGEPTLHPDFSKICSYALDKNLRVTINSNGLNVCWLKKSKFELTKPIIQISIDGNQLIHEKIRGLNTFEKTLKNVQILSDSFFKVVIATTVTNLNIKSLVLLDNQLSNLSFYRWTLKRVVRSGRADENIDVTTEDWNQFVKDVVVKFKNINRIRINPMYSLDSFAKKHKKYSNEELSMLGANCGTGRNKFYINPNGTVYPCACMENQIVGDFNSNNLHYIINKLNSLDIYPNSNSICNKCPAWNRCQGGCVGINFSNKRNGDIRCPMVSLYNNR